ncbi:hypothetical protein KVR801_360145 [Klebsiella variicola]|nr:hypothetical protein KVR801_360145 [Klebsiella variicola]
MLRQEMIPHDIEGDGGDATGLRAKPLPRLFDFRQVVSHHVNPAMHIDAVDDLRRIVALRVAAHKIGHQVAGQRAVGEMGEMQVGEKIHKTTSFKYERAGGISDVALNGASVSAWHAAWLRAAPLPPVRHSVAAWRHSE